MRFKPSTKKLAKMACATLVMNCLPSVSTIQSPYPRFITTTTEFPSLIKPVTRIHNNHIHYVPAQSVRKVRPIAFNRMLAAPTAHNRQKEDILNGKMPNLVSADGPTSASSLVSRILQVALGLFVTTMELPPMPLARSNHHSLGFDCDFTAACRWSSVGTTSDRWRLGRGQPDVFLWLAATGTMVVPVEPFTLLEIHSESMPDMLCSDIIGCQHESSLFSFTFWAIGNSDLEICLLDLNYRQFNCTGMLQSHIQPAKVSLKIPPVNYPFRIGIISSTDAGILVIDDITYNPKYCAEPPLIIEPLPLYPIDRLTTETIQNVEFTNFNTFPSISTLSQSMLTFPSFATMSTNSTIQTVSLPTITPNDTIATSTFFPLTTIFLPVVFPFVTSKQVTIIPETFETSTIQTPVKASSIYPLNKPTFDLLIIGNRTTPFFDRRRGEIIQESNDLICDFANNFSCLWGPESGKWAIIDRGAIPWLDLNIPNYGHVPTYPAVVAIQSSAVLVSDPLRCQTGEGQLLFRYWTNSRVLIQVCAVGHNMDSSKIQCVEEVTKSVNSINSSVDGDDSLAAFKLSNSIREPFVLSITPIWNHNSQNSFIVIDEIAYIGECNLTALAMEVHSSIGKNVISSIDGFPLSGTASKSTENSENYSSSNSKSESKSKEENKKIHSFELLGNKLEVSTIQTTLSLPSIISSTTEEPDLKENFMVTDFLNIKTNKKSELPWISDENVGVVTTKLWIPKKFTTKGTRYPFLPTLISTLRSRNSNSVTVKSDTTTHIYSLAGVTLKQSEFTTKESFLIPNTKTQNNAQSSIIDYCKILNCDFNENACNYLNHGLTKVPWTLRSKSYGFPLTRHTDLRPTSSNRQFISTILNPSDFAILESAPFNITQSINVLLFQYYRPTHSSTIRLCINTKNSKPFRTVASFLQCPPILRSITPKNSFKWSSANVQLPPGTTNFYLIAHNLDQSIEKTAIAIDNIRVAICDPRSQSDIQLNNRELYSKK